MSPRVITAWSLLPPVVFDQNEAFSTRVLENQHRKMKEALEWIAGQNLPGNWAVEKAKGVLNDLKIMKGGG